MIILNDNGYQVIALVMMMIDGAHRSKWWQEAKSAGAQTAPFVGIKWEILIRRISQNFKIMCEVPIGKALRLGGTWALQRE